MIRRPRPPILRSHLQDEGKSAYSRWQGTVWGSYKSQQAAGSVSNQALFRTIAHRLVGSVLIFVVGGASKRWMTKNDSQPSSSKTHYRITLFMTGLAGGGAERVMLTLAEAFVDRGYVVDLVVTNARGSLTADVPEAVRLVDLGASRIIASLPALVRYFRNEKPTVMLSAMASANCMAVWARQLSGARTRLILSEHSHLSIASANAPTRRGRFLPVLMRRAYQKADHIVAVSCGVADDLAATLQLPRDRVHVIYNPVITPRMLKLSKDTVDNEWFGDDHSPVLLSVGRLAAPKDYSTLLRAFAELRAKREARLMILGEGEERDALEELAKALGVQEDVALPGFVSNPYAYMRAAAAFVLSSRWEGFGNVLAEALACGTPVVSTDCPSGPAEILENGRWGELTPIGNVAALAEAIERSLDGDIPACREARIARAQVFSASRAVDGYMIHLNGGADG